MVALLVGIGFADRLVPAGWMGGWGTTARISTTYTDVNGRGVMHSARLEYLSEGAGGVAVASSVRVTFDRDPWINDQPFLPQRTRAQADAELVKQATAVAARQHADVIPLLPGAIATSGETLHVTHPERRFAAAMMEVRDKTRLGGEGTCFWLLVLPVWLWLLCVKWKAVLWSRRVNACGTCGYDLAGLPGGAVCPECGKAS